MILPYLIKSTLCLAVLLGFYKVALESKAMHQFKRFYLLGSLIFAFTIPLVTFTYETEAVIEQPVVHIVQEFSAPLSINSGRAAIPEKNYTYAILVGIYAIGVLIFGLRFGLNLFRLKRKIESAKLISEKDFTLALLTKTIVPHSFLRWIFLNDTEYQNQRIAPEVIAHEATHVRQKHTWDILFVELLQVVFWFNPLIWFSKVSIKLNHEFLADQGALENKSNIAIYQNILLSYASSTHHTTLESPLNHSLTKKRIVMLSQSFSRKRVVLRALLFVPIMALCVLFFNQAIVAQAKPNDLAAVIPREPIATKWLKLWQNKEEYKLFLDEIPIDNETILAYDSQELVYFETKFMDGQTHVSIWTTDYWKKQNEMGYSNFSNTDFKNVPRVHINGKSITVNGNPSSIATYVSDLNAITQNWTTADHRSTFPINITVENRDEKFIKLFDQKLQETNHWKANISYTEPSQKATYATQFIEGAQRNGKKPLVIEIRNDQITINGKLSSLSTLKKDIDAITQDWKESDFNNAARTFMWKDNSSAFLEKAEREFQKTRYAKMNKGAKLIPPPPPAPPAPDFPAPASPSPPAPNFPTPVSPPSPPSAPNFPSPVNAPSPPSTLEHLKKMDSLGGSFLYENKNILYDQAVDLAKSNKNLNIRTPYPYSKPPKTFLSKSEVDPKSKSYHNNLQAPPAKNGGFSFNSSNREYSSLSIFSKIEEYPITASNQNITDNVSFAPSSIKVLSKKIRALSASEKFVDSIVKTENIVKEDININTEIANIKKSNIKNYDLGGYIVGSSSTKKETQDYQIVSQTTYSKKKPK